MKKHHGVLPIYCFAKIFVKFSKVSTLKNEALLVAHNYGHSSFNTGRKERSKLFKAYRLPGQNVTH